MQVLLGVRLYLKERSTSHLMSNIENILASTHEYVHLRLSYKAQGRGMLSEYENMLFYRACTCKKKYSRLKIFYLTTAVTIIAYHSYLFFLSHAFLPSTQAKHTCRVVERKSVPLSTFFLSSRPPPLYSFRTFLFPSLSHPFFSSAVDFSLVWLCR